MKEALERLEGFFVGMLSDDELLLFNEGVKLGLCRRAYEGAGGFMGLAVVRMNP